MTAEPVPMFEGLRAGPLRVDGRSIRQGIDHSSGLALEFRVENLRNTPTGVHGKAGIYLIDNDSEGFIASDHFNIERSEDRQRLANRAFKRLGAVAQKAFTNPEQFNILFDDFCVRAWPAQIESVSATRVSPVSAIEPVELYTPFLPVGGGTIMFAPPGSAKTFLGLLTAYSVEYGISTFFPVRRARTLYVNLERSEPSMRRRLHMICSALDIPMSDILMINRRGAAITDLEDAIVEAVRQHGVELVIIDSLSRFGGGTLNDDSVMNRAMDLLNRVCPTWLLIAHAPRADATHAFGSVMQDAAADVMLQLAAEETQNLTTGISLTVTKANDIPKGHVTTLALHFDRDYGLTHIRQARSGEFVQLEGQEADRRPAKQRIIDYLKNNGDADAITIAEALNLGRTSVTSALADHTVFTKTTRDGHKQRYGLLAFHEEPA